MSRDVIKRGILAKLPEGALRQLEEGGDEDLLYDGITDALLEGYDQMAGLSSVRNPDITIDLDTLEREYGFLKNSNLTEEDRRARIKALKYAPAGSGSPDALKTALDLGGFSQLVVAEGRMTQDPDLVRTVAGEYVVNGFDWIRIRGYETGCQRLTSPVSYPTGCQLLTSPVSYPTGCTPLQQVRVYPQYDPSDNWHLVFFVAGAITLDANGYVTSMTEATIPRIYRDMVREIILRIKPQHTWCYLAVDWSDPAGFGFGFFPFGISPHGI